MYYHKETQVIISQLVYEFYTQFLFKIYALPQDVVLPLYNTKTLFNNMIPGNREFLI